jgi:hypothetical protein
MPAGEQIVTRAHKSWLGSLTVPRPLIQANQRPPGAGNSSATPCAQGGFRRSLESAYFLMLMFRADAAPQTCGADWILVALSGHKIDYTYRVASSLKNRLEQVAFSNYRAAA